MAGRSNIEWTEATWNPVVGCSVLSPGCTNCYAMRTAARIEAMNLAATQAGKAAPAPQYVGTTKTVNGNPVWTGKLSLAREGVLLEPLKRKKPTLYFVNSMGDLFHEDVPDEWIDQVFLVMGDTPQHTYQILTKRATRMRAYMESYVAGMRPAIEFQGLWRAPQSSVPIGHDGARALRPLPNVWLGVSAERQQEADERIPLLLLTPAAVRFVSAEPLLGPIDLTALNLAGVTSQFDALMHGTTFTRDRDGQRFYHSSGHPTLDWVICGGESGPGARPIHPDWARPLRDQCAAAGVPFFFKQWGQWVPYTLPLPDHARLYKFGHDGQSMLYAGRKRAGRQLDGVLHDEMPAAFMGRPAP